MPDYGATYTDQVILDLDKKIRKVYKEAAKDIDKKMQDFNAKYKVKERKYQQKVANGQMTQEEFDKWKKGQVFQGKQWQAKKDEIAEVLHNSNVVAAGIVNGKSLNVFGTNLNYSSYQIEHDTGVNFGFTLYDQDTVANLIKEEPNLLPKYVPKKSKDMTWNYKKITGQITQGIIQGESLDKISKRLATVTASQNMNSMKTHARTLMTGAQNSGRLIGYQKAQDLGIEMQKEWMATFDAHTRDSHRDLDGEKVDIDKPFSNKLMYPGDPDGAPAEVYNCRCTMVSEVKKYPSSYNRYDNIDGKRIDNMSYKDWAKAKKLDDTPSKMLINGKNDPELTDSIYDYFLPKNTRQKLSMFEELHSYNDFKTYLDKKGIDLDTDLEKLKTTMSQDDIPAVKEMMQKVVTAIDSYEEMYGENALSALKKIKLYDQDLDTHAAYYFNLLGEKDPLAGTICFSDWNASGRDIYHELAHALQDSMKNDNEDVIIFANRIATKINIPKTAYSGTGELIGEEAAENMAENMAFGFARGSEKGIQFIEEFRDEMEREKKISFKRGKK